MPEQRDSEFTWKGYQETTNTELVGNLAGFVHRVMVLNHKNYSGVVPSIDTNREFKSGWDAETYTNYEEELHRLYEKMEAIGREIEQFNFREAMRILMEISSAGNALLQFNEPWKASQNGP